MSFDPTTPELRRVLALLDAALQHVGPLECEDALWPLVPPDWDLSNFVRQSDLGRLREKLG